MKNNYNLRSQAAKSIGKVLDSGQSLSTVLPEMQKTIKDIDRPLLKELCFGVLRVLPQLEWYIQQLMHKPIIGKQRPIHYLLIIGLYQLLYTRIPHHAVLAETVNGSVALKCAKFKGLVNGILRQFLRKKDTLIWHTAGNNYFRYLHPMWLLQRIQHAYPLQWQHILDANNQRPPMWLRVNRLRYTREAYLKLMKQSGIDAEPHVKYSDALRLIKPCNVNALPGFANGWVTVQDVSSQGCIALLDPKNNEKILDLCAAPGVKTTYILEVAPKAKVIAIDINERRLTYVKENLQRLKLYAKVKVGDGRHPQQWCGKKHKRFDRILLDAPCSGTGVIRRHPDIKWLRRDCDIVVLAKLQGEMLKAVWPYLKSGGVLLYVTCSILPEENSEQIAIFLEHHNDAKLITVDSLDQQGLQKLPSPKGGDGFFYAKLIKI